METSAVPDRIGELIAQLKGMPPKFTDGRASRLRADRCQTQTGNRRAFEQALLRFWR